MYDRQILQLVGLDTYCRLHRHEPELYVGFTDCEGVTSHQNHIEAAIDASGHDALTVKRHLVIVATGGPRSAIAEELVNSSPAPHLSHLADDRMSQALWFVWFILIVAIVVYCLITLGVVDSVFTGQDSLLSRVVS